PAGACEIINAAVLSAVGLSHTPPSAELLELADQMGLLVMDEAFDMWRIPKVPNGYSKYFDQWSEQDVRDMVRRDRNHPRIILWSIGNEDPQQGRPDGWQQAHRPPGFFFLGGPPPPPPPALPNCSATTPNKPSSP